MSDLDYFIRQAAQYRAWAADAERDGRPDDAADYTRGAERCEAVARNIRRKAAAIANAAAAERAATRGVCGG